MLIQLTYASRTSRLLGPADVKDILGASQRNNARAGITGALCLNHGIFLQQLEGDRTAVNALYHRLLKDSRHKDTAVLDFGEIPPPAVCQLVHGAARVGRGQPPAVPQILQQHRI